MTKAGKRIRKLRDQVKPGTTPINDALTSVVEAGKSTKFDQTIDVAIVLNIDVKTHNIRGMCDLPHGTGKSIKLAVFAEGPQAEQAKKAGADFVSEDFGVDELIAKIRDGEVSIDLCIATPQIMAKLGKANAGKVLGPKGLMPNPKLGTVTEDVASAVDKAKKGQVEFRNEKAGIIHAGIGKASFSSKALKENLEALVNAVQQARPTGIKGAYISRIYIGSTMGPSIEFDVNELQAA